jgi:uncharacterized protein YoaH (UPF0181 family)
LTDVRQIAAVGALLGNDEGIHIVASLLRNNKKKKKFDRGIKKADHWSAFPNFFDA